MAVTHAHLKRDGEMGDFLFRFKKQKGFDTELFDRYRQAHYSASAIYELPFTVAESLIQKHNIPRDVFLKKIEHKMTSVEKLRLQTSNAKARARDARLDFDLSRAPLTKLALYIMSLSMSERIERGIELHEAMSGSAARSIASTSFKLGRVATVLDRSRSSIGSRQKQNRPLAVALAASYLLRKAATEYQSFWTVPLDQCNELSIDAQEILVTSAGQTSLADPLIDALQWQPDVLIIVSDGFENSPPMAANQVVGTFRNRLQSPDQKMEIIHMNPVFDVDHFAPRPLGDSMATVGLRDAEDIATMMGFARFARGSTPIAELEAFLEMRMHSMLGAAEGME